VLIVALLVAVQVIRNAAVAGLAQLHPEIATRIWSGHPAVEISLGLEQIGLASRARKAVSRSTFAMVDAAASKSPLSPQPFLVHGVQAQLAGREADAQRNFTAAQWRDPRSLPAAYFLAGYYLSNGRPLEGLRQTTVVARLSPGGIYSMAPFLAQYAQDPKHWPQMRALFKSVPVIEELVLAALANDPRNTAALLALADSAHRSSSSGWLPTLLSGLVKNGDYGRARAIWGSVGNPKAAASGLLYDPNFSEPKAPPPFNWALPSSPVGLAERQPGNRLNLIFYGQQDGVLASQLLLLAPGSYLLRMKPGADSVHAELLGWSLRCDKPSSPISTATLESAARGWRFTVPANGPAQWLELSGRSGDIAQQADVTIGSLSLTREPQGG
jgi:hypothetical protein